MFILQYKAQQGFHFHTFCSKNMVRSRVFVCVAVTLCFVSCLCAQATVSEAKATKAVQDAKKSTVNALKIAEYELKNAEKVKRDMEWYESKAEKKVSEAEAAAKEETTNKARANGIAQNLKSELTYARTLYPNAKTDTDTAIKALHSLLLKARQLDQKAEKEIVPNRDSQNNYSIVWETALGVKGQAEALETEIANAKKLLSAGKSIILAMPAPNTNDLIKKHQSDGLAAGAVLDTIVSKAESIFQNIEHKKNDVNMTVETIKKILKTNPQTLSPRINVFLTTAQSDLVKILEIMNESHESHQNIMKLKQYAEGSTERLNGKTDETSARRELRFINFYAESSASALEKMKKTLIAAEPYVRSANHQRRSATEELLKDDSALNGEKNAGRQKPETTVENTATISPKQPEGKTKPEKEKSKEDTRNISTSQKAERQANQQKEKHVEETTVKPTKKNSVQLTHQDKQEPAEAETTTETSNTVKVPTDKKPDQLTEAQTSKSTRKATEGQTENKPEQSTEKVTEPPQKYGTVELRMRNSKTTIIETSQNLAHQGADKREMKKKMQANDDKSKVLKLDTLPKSANNETKVPFVWENVPASTAWSDVSMIVSVPLLTALIASAILH